MENPPDPEYPAGSQQPEEKASGEEPPVPEVPAAAEPASQGSAENLPPSGAATFGNPYQRDYTQPPLGYANYPRYLPANKGPVPPGPPVVRFAAIGEAWELIRQDYATFILAIVVMGAVGYGIGAIIQAPLQFMMMGQTPQNILWPFPNTINFWATYTVVVSLSQIVQYVLGAGYFSICIKRLRGEPVAITNLFDGLKLIGPLAAAGIVTFWPVFLGSLLLVVPGVFAAGAFAFVPQLIIDQKARPMEAIALSFQAVKKDVFMMGMLVFVAYILSFMGGFACCIGVVFTAPLYYMILALHYHAYFPPQGGPEQVPVMPAAPQYSI